jgi:Protein of unknown function (DUF3574)
MTGVSVSHRRKSPVALLGLLLGVFALACSASFEAPPAQGALPACNGWGGKPVARTELFFGLTRPDGSTVSTHDFQRFVDQQVTPRFPAGLTLLGGNGQFRDTNGITIKEGSKLLILLYPYDRDNSRAIESIRTAYMTTFRQESVLRVDGSACVSF